MANNRTEVHKFEVTSKEHLAKVKKKVEELEKWMGYKCQSLSQMDQDRQATNFRNAIRMQRWLD